MNVALWTEPLVHTTFCWAVCSPVGQINLIGAVQPFVRRHRCCKQFIWPPKVCFFFLPLPNRHLRLHFCREAGRGRAVLQHTAVSVLAEHQRLPWMTARFLPALHSLPELPFIAWQWGQCFCRPQSLTAAACDTWVKVLWMIRGSRSRDLTEIFFFLRYIVLLKDDA